MPSRRCRFSRSVATKRRLRDEQNDPAREHERVDPNERTQAARLNERAEGVSRPESPEDDDGDRGRHPQEENEVGGVRRMQ
jgi:hypothetical protein